MDIVADASAIIAVVANQPERDTLVRLTKGADLVAPHSVHWEIGNAFSAMMRRGRVGLDQVTVAVQRYQGIPIRFLDVELERSLEIADRLGIYAYDAYIIRCAVKYRAPLLTLDQELVSSARRMGVEVME